MQSGVDSGSRVIAGRYRLLDPLGTGGMGTVWLAEDVVLGREVAVKEVTFPRGLSDEDRAVLRERTRREARAAARLDHPSAVTVYDVIEDGGAPYLVMEYVDARTLAQVVKSDGPLSPQRTAEVGLALLGALEAAHRQGIVHRDVKPGNVMLRSDGRVVLTDFGIATSTGDSSITSTGLLLGSPSYIAPERAKGEQPGPASDLWSLGATMFTAVEGRPPYDAGEPLLTVTAVVTGEHAPFVSAGPLVPVLEGLLERDPEQRLTAPAARQALLEVIASATQADTRPGARPSSPSNPDKPAERTAALLVGGGHEPLAAETAVASPTTAEPAPPARPRLRRPALAPVPTQPPAHDDQVGPAPRRRWAVPALLALALLAAVGVAGFALSSDEPRAPGTVAAQDPVTAATPDGQASAPASAAPSAAPSAPAPPGATPAPAASLGASPAAGAVPAGWETYTSKAGWTAAVPASYQQSAFRSGQQYRDARTGRTLRVETTAPGGGKDDAVQDREGAAASFAKRHPSYEEIGISAVDYRGYEAADWEFTYTDGGAELHVLNRVFVVDGRGHSLYFFTRASDDWDAARAEFEQMAAAFQPAG